MPGANCCATRHVSVSLGLAPQPGEPDGPVNWVPHHVTIEHGDGLVHVSSRAAMPTVDIKCRLLVLNPFPALFAWGQTAFGACS